jgi:hypothetical protein
MLKISGVKAHCLSPIRHEADMKDGMFQRDARFKRSSAKIGDSSLERMDHLCRRGLAAFAARFQPGEKAMKRRFHCGISRMGCAFFDVLHDLILELAGRCHVRCLCQPNHKFFVAQRFIREFFGMLLFERRR